MKLKLLLTLAASGVALGYTPAQDMPLSQIIRENEGWQLVKEGYGKIDLLLPRPGGQVWVYHDKGVARISSDGVREIGAETTAIRPPQFRTSTGHLYVIRGNPPKVELLEPKAPMIRMQGVAQPAGLTASLDGSTLFVGDAAGKAIWAFRIENDGRLTAGEPYCPLRLLPGRTKSGVTALATDAAGRIYACTPLGVQIFDPTGRLCGVLLKSDDGELTALAFGGNDLDMLYVACGGGVYARKLLAKGLPAER